VKILHIISSGGMYGAEAVILNLSRTLNEGGHSAVLAVFSNSSNPNLQLHEAAVNEGIESHLVPCEGQIDRTVLTRIRDLAAKTNPDVVHTHGYKADIYAYFAMRKSHIPLVSTCHGWIDLNATVALYGIADRIVLRRFAAVVAVSDEVKRKLIEAGVSENRIHLVRNGIDLRPFDHAQPSLRSDSTNDDSLIVGLIGRLSIEKGVDNFLEAAARVLSELPTTKFVVIGEGPDRDKLESLIDNLKIRDNASMLGRRTDMPSIYASLDIMVSSSRQEGLPIAILEGMASSLPIVATAVGEVPTLISTDETGVLVPSQDVQALASATVTLLQNPAERQRLGSAARRLIEEAYSAGRMTNEYLGIYQMVSQEKTK
jgi:glycosyltransferase involved in cell wall biosynthesis